MKIILVIDAQNDFIKESPNSFGSKHNEIIANDIAVYLSKEKEKPQKKSIIFTQNFHIPEEYEKTVESKYYALHCEPDTEGFEIYENLKPFASISFRKESFASIPLINAIATLGDVAEEEIEIELMGFNLDTSVLSTALLIRSVFPEAKMSVLCNLCSMDDDTIDDTSVFKILTNQGIYVSYAT